MSEPVSKWPFVGMGGMAAILFLYAASGLLTPPWAVAGLVAVWFAVVNAGGAWLGWSA